MSVSSLKSKELLNHDDLMRVLGVPEEDIPQSKIFQENFVNTQKSLAEVLIKILRNPEDEEIKKTLASSLGVAEEMTGGIIEQIKSQTDSSNFQIPPLSLVQKYLDNPTAPEKDLVIPIEKVVVVAAEKEKEKPKEKEKEKEKDSDDGSESKAKKLAKITPTFQVSSEVSTNITKTGVVFRSAGYSTVLVLPVIDAGIWRCEFKMQGLGNDSMNLIGIVAHPCTMPLSSVLGFDASSCQYGFEGPLVKDGVQVANLEAWRNDDLLAMEADMGRRQLWFYRNAVRQPHSFTEIPSALQFGVGIGGNTPRVELVALRLLKKPSNTLSSSSDYTHSW